VLVDDGATDRCPAIVDDYAKKHENVVSVHQKNGGLAAARITGLKHASGDYIGWVDADDFISPSMYEELYALLRENKADYVYCDYEFYPHKVASKEKWFNDDS
jgi:Glycosyltransferases involved in cell wall biogenesis